MSKAVPIGLTNLVYSIMIDDIPPSTAGGTDGYTAYNSSVRVLGAITATFSPNASNDTLFADDGPYDTASTLGAMTLELNVADIPPAQRAELLGADYDEATGILSHSGADIPPYVAVGMSVKKSNGFDRLIWYLKGKFSVPDDNNQTKADSINWNTPTITGNFLKRDSDQKWRISVDTDDANVDQATIANWFTSPDVAASSIASVAAPTFTPASGTLSKAAATTVAIASATAEAVIEYKFSNESVWKTYSAAISTSTWTAGTVVVINARASKVGMLTKQSNAAFSVTA